MKLKGIFSAVIAGVCGALVLAGYFVKLPFLVNTSNILLNWAILLAAFAILVGIINLLIVHFGKMSGGQKGAFYSLILIIALLVTFVVGILSSFIPKLTPAFDFIFRAFQLPVEASLMAILAISLTYASIRLMRNRRSVFAIIFLITSILVLLGTAPLPFIGDTPILSDGIRPFFAQVMASSGARGILIGVALGTLTTGLRILFGIDRPYKGNG